MKLSRTSKIAVSSSIVALCVAVMMLTFMNVVTLAAPAIAGLLLVVIVIEVGWKWALLSYAAVCLLSFMTPDKEALLLFITFLGYYPILKAKIERIDKKILRILIKILLFNASVVLTYSLLILVFGIPMDPVEEIFGDFIYPAFFLVANFLFLLYDLGITRAITFYWVVLHPKLQKILKRS